MSYAQNIDTLLSRSGSPLEQVFAIALYHHLDNMTIRQQVRMGRYTVDFVIERNGREVVVEVDGHDYHERTKEQAAHDRKRDRWMAAQGHKVMRFTGSEVWKDAVACVREVDALLSPLLPLSATPYRDKVDIEGAVERARARHSTTPLS